MVKAEVDAVDVDVKTGNTLGFYRFGTDRPNVFVLSAMDGLSATGVYATYLIMKHLEGLPRIDGSLTMLPVANPLSFRLGTKLSPLDSLDLDTVFPGDERGTVTQRTAWEIWRRVSQADYVISLRTGWQSCMSHIVALHREYIHVRNMASQIALPLVVQASGNRGSLITEAAHEGIAAVSVETRGNKYQVEPQAAVEVREAILNFLRIKDMIPGERIEASSTLAGRMQHVNTNIEGFFVPTTRPGENVRPNDVIGQVQDKGDVVSLFGGTIVSLSEMNYVFEGDVIGRIATPLAVADQRSEPEPSIDRTAPRRRKW
jgi:predicted deacylase